MIHLKLANNLFKILKLGEVHSKNVSRPSLVSLKKNVIQNEFLRKRFRRHYL